MAVIWRFRHYVSTSGTGDVKATYDSGSAQKRARFLSRLKLLAGLPLEEWNENYRKTLSGACDGLEELRFKADNVQQRPLGYRSGPNEFTILFWATEKGGKFVPASACATALERKKLSLANRSLTNAIWLALE